MNLNSQDIDSLQSQHERWFFTESHGKHLLSPHRKYSTIRKTSRDIPKYQAEKLIESAKKGLGNNANNVENHIHEPAKGTTIHPLKRRNHKPNRYINHEIKRTLSQLGISETRTKHCGCKTIGTGAILSIDTRHGNARAAGIETCGSVWACPVCREKIMNERSSELKKIGDKWKKLGGHTTLLTLTFSHKHGDDLQKLLGNSNEKTGLKGAVRMFRQSYYWKEFKDRCRYEADCRSLEITWGKNGFHPHIHMLIYHRKKLDKVELSLIKQDLYQNWLSACVDAGLESPNFANGIDIRRANSDDYIAKWGMVQELASPQRKKGKESTSMSIPEMEFKLLELPVHNQESRRIQKLLYMYYRVVKGSKLLTWGGNSFKKEILGEDEKTDLELATIQIEELKHLWAMVEIPSSQWQSIYWRGHTADVKTILERGGLGLLHKWAKIQGYDVSKWKQLPEDYYQKIAEEKEYSSFQYREVP